MTLTAKISKVLEEIFDVGDPAKIIESKDVDNTPFKLEEKKLRISHTEYPEELHSVYSN